MATINGINYTASTLQALIETQGDTFYLYSDEPIVMGGESIDVPVWLLSISENSSDSFVIERGIDDQALAGEGSQTYQMMAQGDDLVIDGNTITVGFGSYDEQGAYYVETISYEFLGMDSDTQGNQVWSITFTDEQDQVQTVALSLTMSAQLPMSQVTSLFSVMNFDEVSYLAVNPEDLSSPSEMLSSIEPVLSGDISKAYVYGTELSEGLSRMVSEEITISGDTITRKGVFKSESTSGDYLEAETFSAEILNQSIVWSKDEYGDIKVTEILGLSGNILITLESDVDEGSIEDAIYMSYYTEDLNELPTDYRTLLDMFDSLYDGDTSGEPTSDILEFNTTDYTTAEDFVNELNGMGYIWGYTTSTAQGDIGLMYDLASSTAGLTAISSTMEMASNDSDPTNGTDYFDDYDYVAKNNGVMLNGDGSVQIGNDTITFAGFYELDSSSNTDYTKPLFNIQRSYTDGTATETFTNVQLSFSNIIQNIPMEMQEWALEADYYPHPDTQTNEEGEGFGQFDLSALTDVGFEDYLLNIGQSYYLYFRDPDDNAIIVEIEKTDADSGNVTLHMGGTTRHEVFSSTWTYDVDGSIQFEMPDDDGPFGVLAGLKILGTSSEWTDTNLPAPNTGIVVRFLEVDGNGSSTADEWYVDHFEANFGKFVDDQQDGSPFIDDGKARFVLGLGESTGYSPLSDAEKAGLFSLFNANNLLYREGDKDSIRTFEDDGNGGLLLREYFGGISDDDQPYTEAYSFDTSSYQLDSTNGTVTVYTDENTYKQYTVLGFYVDRDGVTYTDQILVNIEVFDDFDDGNGYVQRDYEKSVVWTMASKTDTDLPADISALLAEYDGQDVGTTDPNDGQLETQYGENYGEYSELTATTITDLMGQNSEVYFYLTTPEGERIVLEITPDQTGQAGDLTVYMGGATRAEISSTTWTASSTTQLDVTGDFDGPVSFEILGTNSDGVVIRITENNTDTYWDDYKQQIVEESYTYIDDMVISVTADPTTMPAKHQAMMALGEAGTYQAFEIEDLNIAEGSLFYRVGVEMTAVRSFETDDTGALVLREYFSETFIDDSTGQSVTDYWVKDVPTENLTIDGASDSINVVMNTDMGTESATISVLGYYVDSTGLVDTSKIVVHLQEFKDGVEAPYESFVVWTMAQVGDALPTEVQDLMDFDFENYTGPDFGGTDYTNPVATITELNEDEDGNENVTPEITGTGNAQDPWMAQLFKVSLKAGNEYKFVVEHEGRDWDWVNVWFEDANKNPIWDGMRFDDNGREVTFTPAETGDYYMFVSNLQGDFEIDIENQGVADAVANTMAEADTAGAITLDGNGEFNFDGKIHTWSDLDVFKITVAEGEQGYTYNIGVESDDYNWIDTLVMDATGAAQIGSVEDWQLWDIALNWEDGVEWKWDSSGDYDSMMEFTPMTAGDYYLVVRGSETDYELDISKSTVASDDYADFISGAQALELSNGSAAITGTINDNWDNDYFFFQATAGNIYELTVDAPDLMEIENWGAYAEFGVDVYRLVDDGQGGQYEQWLGWNEGVQDDWEYQNDGNGRKVLISASQTETLYFSVRGWGSEGDYSINLVETADSDAVGSTVDNHDTTSLETIGTEYLTTPIDGTIDRESDQDWYAFTATAGQLYEFELKSDSMDWMNMIVVKVNQETDYSWNEHLWDQTEQNWVWNPETNTSDTVRMTFEPTSDGVYYLQVEGDKGNFTLNAKTTEAVADDAGDNRYEATAITLNADHQVETVQSGVIDSWNDQDFWSVDLKAGQKYSIKLSSDDINQWNLGLNIFTDENVQAPSQSGDYVDEWQYQLDWRQIEEDWNYDGGRRYLITVDTDATYYIKAESWGNQGTYELAIESLGADIAGNDTTDQTVAFDENGEYEVSSTVGSTNDHDWFKLVADGTSSYEILVTSNEVWPSLDIRQAGQNSWVNEGINWTWDQDLESQGVQYNKIIFTPTTAGDYFIDVGSWEQGKYTLSVSEMVVDDEVGNTATTAGVITTAGVFDTDGTTALTETSITDSWDRDWFAFEVTQADVDAEKSFAFEMTAAASADNTRDWIGAWMDIVQIKTEGEGDNTWEYEEWLWDEVSHDWNFNPDDNWETPDQRIIFAPTVAGTYYLNIGGDSAIDYSLSMKEYTVTDDYGSTVTKAAIFADEAVDGIVSGSTDFQGDQDWFKFTVEQDQSYLITLDSVVDAQDGSFIDWPNMEIRNDEGHGVWNGVFYDWSYGDQFWDYNTGMQTGGGQQIVFTAREAGDFFVNVNNWEIGDYTLAIVEQNNGTDEVGASPSKAGTIAIDSVDSTVTVIQNAAGEDLASTSIAGSWDRDWFAFEVTQAHLDNEDSLVFEMSAQKAAGNESTWIGAWMDIMRVNTEGTGDNAYTWEEYLWENVNHDWNYNPDGDWNTPDQRIIFTPTEVGTYYLNMGGDSAIDYTLSMSTETNTDDYGSSLTDFGVFSTLDADEDGVISATLDSTWDQDWFKISVQADVTYKIELNSGTMDGVYLDVLNKQGNWMWEGVEWDWQATSVDERIYFTPKKAGEYFINVGGWEQGDYELSFGVAYDDENVATDDYASTYADSTDADTATGEAGTLTTRAAVTGDIETQGDVDWFEVQLLANTTYQFDVKTDERAFGEVDTIIQGVYMADGTLISGSYDDDSGAGVDAKVVLRTDDTGGGEVVRGVETATYYVAVSAWGTGSYTLDLTEVTLTEETVIADDTSTTGQLIVGTEKTGKIDFAYDEDWYKVTLTGGQEYVITMTGKESGKGTLKDTVINYIYDENGTLIQGTYNDDANYSLESEVAFTPTASGVYYVAAAAVGTQKGTYTLNVSLAQTDTADPTLEEADTITDVLDVDNGEDAGVLTLGTAVSAAIEPAGDVDIFKIALDAETTYEISMYGDSSDQGTLIDPVITAIYDASGNSITGMTNDNGGLDFDAYLEFTPDAAGDYYIEVASSIDTATGSYKVKVKEQADPNATQTVTSVSNAATVDTDGVDTWTIMVYLAADNNLEAMALDDLNEMELGGLPDNVNVTFLIDRTEGYSSAEGDWTDTRRGVIEADTDALSISSSMESIGEQNMGDADTLTDFINWSAQTAAADNYALVVWDHGGGISGVAWDDTDGGDNLTINEVTQAITASNVDNFGMVGFDACLQGVLDQTYALRDVADIVVASEELEPGDGWDYTGWFDKLATSNADGQITTAELTNDLVESYGEFYEDFIYMDTTLSAVDTDLVDEVMDAFEAFNDSLATATAEQRTKIKQASLEVTEFGGYYGGYIDLGDLAQEVDALNLKAADGVTASAIDTAAAALFTAVNNAVTANATTAEDAFGISVYYPGFNDQTYLDTFEVASQTNMAELFDVLA